MDARQKLEKMRNLKDGNLEVKTVGLLEIATALVSVRFFVCTALHTITQGSIEFSLVHITEHTSCICAINI